MMKKNRLTLMSTLILMLLAAFTFSAAYAQEAKEKKKAVKIKVTAEDNGDVTIDTTYLFNEDFEGNWEELIGDEALMEKLEELDIDLEIEDGGQVFILKSPSSQKKGYSYTTSIDGDSTITVILKPDGDMKDCKKEVMVWNADSKHKAHNKMVMSQNMTVDLEVVDGDTVKTYTIEMEGEGDEHGDNVIFWTSEAESDGEHEVIIKRIHGKDKEFEFIGHDEPIIITQTIIISDIDAGEKDMLSDAGIKFGNEELHTGDFTVNMDPDSENLKISFEVHELRNVSISMLNGIGKQIYLEELKALSGKYIREIELPAGPGDYYFHVKSGKKSLTRKISLD